MAYLAIERDRRHYREALAGLLWPAQPTDAARGSLRQALQVLRRALGDEPAARPYFLVSRETIQFNPAADFWLDVAALENLTPLGTRRPLASREPADCETLRAAVALYRGPLLQEFALDDSPAFEEWLLLKREQLNRQALQALNVSAAAYEQDCAYDEALACVRRIIELEPWHEEAQDRKSVV